MAGVQASSQGDPAATRTFVDFSAAPPAAAWIAVDDGVMGGVSHSTIVDSGNGTALFSGTVSLANNGGFASVRTLPGDLSAPGCDGVELRVRGDGKRYRLRLRDDDRFDGVAFSAPFVAPANEWVEVRLPFAVFVPTFRGERVPAHPPLDPARIRQIGVMIADQQAGSFRLELAWLRAYRGD